MTTSVLITLVLVKDGVNVYLLVKSKTHQQGWDGCCLMRIVDVIKKVSNSVNDHQSYIGHCANQGFDNCHTCVRIILAKCDHQQVIGIGILRKIEQLGYTLQHLLTMYLSLLSIEVKDETLVLRKLCPIVEHRSVRQSSCNHRWYVEGLFTLGLTDGYTEVS